MRALIALALLSTTALACARPPAPERARRLAFESAISDPHDADSPRQVTGLGVEALAGSIGPAHELSGPLAHAPRGERADEYWIFTLELDAAPEYRFWVIVPRDPFEPRFAYNYGERIGPEDLSDGRRTPRSSNHTAPPRRRAGSGSRSCPR